VPNILNQTILVEGTQKADIHFYMESDGASGEWNNTVLFDPATFNVPVADQPDPNYDGTVRGHILPPICTILKMWSATVWFDYTISYETQGQPIPMFTFARDTSFDMDFTEFGGIRVPQPYAFDLTGRLLITTNNFAPAGSAGFLVLKLRKN
jgi:hypothetical protein